MDITILLLLILLSILFHKSHAIIANSFILIAGLFSITGISTNKIIEITGTTITYTTLDPLITYAISTFLITIAVIGYLDMIDERRAKKDEQY